MHLHMAIASSLRGGADKYGGIGGAACSGSSQLLEPWTPELSGELSMYTSYHSSRVEGNHDQAWASSITQVRCLEKTIYTLQHARRHPQYSVLSSQAVMAVARRTLEAGLSVLRGRASRETRPKTAAMPSTKAYQLPPHYSSLIPQYPMQTYVRSARQRGLLSTLRHADPGRTDTHRKGEGEADEARPSRGGEL